MSDTTVSDLAAEPVATPPSPADSHGANLVGQSEALSEALAKARAEEKQKLYPQLERLKEEVALLRKERDEQVSLQEQKRLEAEREAQKKAEAEMEIRDLLSKKELEFQQQLEAVRQEQERALAVLEQERRFNQLMEYRARAIEANRENIMPELIDLVAGNSQEEIDASIAGLIERTSRILESAQAAMQQTRQSMAGARVTAPAAGPLDNEPGQKQFTLEDIRGMSMSEFQQHRDALLGNASGKPKGLFG